MAPKLALPETNLAIELLSTSHGDNSGRFRESLWPTIKDPVCADLSPVNEGVGRRNITTETMSAFELVEFDDFLIPEVLHTCKKILTEWLWCPGVRCCCVHWQVRFVSMGASWRHQKILAVKHVITVLVP